MQQYGKSEIWSTLYNNENAEKMYDNIICLGQSVTVGMIYCFAGVLLLVKH